MKKEKLSLKSIKNVLSRAEMKKIMAGSGPQCLPQGSGCGYYGTGYVPCCPGLTCYGDINGESGLCVSS